MKTFVQIILYLTVTICSVGAQMTESFNAYYLRLNSIDLGNTVQVTIEMALAPAETGKKLGTSTFQFLFDTSKLENPTIVSHNLTASYNLVTLAQPLDGKVALNARLDLIGTGQVINTFPAYSSLAVIEFQTTGMAYTDFVWTDEFFDTRGTIVFFDDENILRHPVEMENVANFFLPVELNQFAANWETEDQQTALLTWGTSSENNLNHFELERSANGIDGWVTLANIPAQGYDNSGAVYNQVDKEAKYNTRDGYVYYRLKMIDDNGSSKVSEIRTLYLDKEPGHINIFPNPFADYLTVESYQNDDKLTKLEIISSNGQQVLGATITGNTNQISVGHLPQGAYILRLVQGTNSFTQTLIKK